MDGENKKNIDGQDTPGSEKYVGNVLPSHFGFKRTCIKGEKGLEFPAKKSGIP